MHKHIHLYVIFVTIALISCKTNTKTEKPQTHETTQPELKVEKERVEVVAEPSPKRIIIFIGDGMGAGAVTAAMYAKGEVLEMTKMPYFSWMSNHEYEYVTTDSAASATAMATGHKTHFEAVAVKPGTTDETDEDPSTHLRTIFEAAKSKGMRTGLVATSRINHATPAAFAAHRYIRNQYEEIASDLVKAKVDVMLGAGSRYFEKRNDKQDLLKVLKEDGYTVTNDPEEVSKAAESTTKLVGLMHEKDMPPVLSGERKMSLRQMTEEAIKVLDRDNEAGWVLLVEGSQIDWCEHDLEGRCTVAETLDFDEAVGYGRQYVSKRKDALMVVTADHETGGASVLDPTLWNYYATPLGGIDKVQERTRGDKGLKLENEEPIPAILAIGDTATKQVTAPQATKGQFGLVDLPDARYTVSFGYVSVESRHIENAAEHKSFSGAHTTTLVPLFAQGAGASKIAEVTDNAELGAQLIKFVDDAKYDTQKIINPTKPKNVILLIGDGMGINSVTAAYYGKGARTMIDAPVKGIVATHGTNAVVNDSAATATALASGERTRLGALGVTYEPAAEAPNPIASILERAEKVGVRTGLVTTTPLTHATPAAFYAHVPNRSMTPEIAQDFVTLKERIEGSDGIDVAIAGGRRDFSGKMLESLKSQGYSIFDKIPAKDARVDKSVIFLADKSLKIAEERARDGEPSLAEMTEAAIDILTTKGGDDKGFFLMVEGGQIDWLLHGETNTDALLTEIDDFDKAVAAAVAFAKKNGDTLVIATADHDHTMSVLDNHYAYQSKGNCLATKACGGPFDLPVIPAAKSGVTMSEGFQDASLHPEGYTPGISFQYDWVVTANTTPISGPHSANFVPLFAWGPGAQDFRSFVDQPEIGKKMFKATGW